MKTDIYNYYNQFRINKVNTPEENDLKIFIGFKQPSGEVHTFEAGYGNPSKHTLISIISYLGFWKLIQKNRFFRKGFGKIINFSLLGIFIFFILCIILSRLYFGYQSINQIIFSILLGI